MKYAVITLLSMLALSGCVTSTPEPVVQTKIVVVSPPAELLTCDRVKTAYDTEKLKVKQSNQYIIALSKRLDECATNAQLARKYVADAEAGINEINANQKAKK